MRISTKLMFAALVPLIVALVVGLALVYSYHTVETAQVNEHIIRQIRSALTELNHLTFSYASYHEERPKQQFSTVYDSLTGLIANARFQNPEQQRLLEDVRVNSQSVRDLFLKLISIERMDATGRDKAYSEAEAVLVGQLLTRSHRADSSAAMLRDLTDKDVGKAQQRATALIFIVLIFATLPLTILMGRTRKSVTRSLVNLRKGIEVIGSGDLEHRLAMPALDELGELARSFDSMTEQLQVVTVSKERLEQEIQERRRAEEELRENEAQLRSILRVAPVGIGTVVDRVINQANDTLCAMTGYAQDELQGQNARLLYPTQDDFELVGREKYEQIADHGTGAVETRWLRKDGTTIDVLLSSTPLDLKDLRKGVTFTALDITERKRAEDALRHAHDELEKRVRERTAELNQAYEELQRGMHERERLESKLRQSHKMEAIGTLAGGIAHDFNNILAAVLGFTEMAIEDVPDRPLVERNLRNVLKSAMRARDLVKQILAFSRKVTHERTPLSLTPLLEETVQLLRASIPTTIEIRLESNASSDTVLASPVEVQQVLMNLATNASLAMQGEGGTMEISLTDIDFEPESPVLVADVAPGEYVQLMVKDTGIGMSHEVMRRAFEPFFTTREPGTGTGMGLAVVYGIVKDLQGMITVESEPGVGSIFRVLLPKVKTRTEEEPAHIVHIRGGTERILFVDDEPMLVDWGQATLERLGYTVTALTDSTEALKTFSSDPRRFDLVITDHTMSGMTGLEVSKELLKIRPDIPIILCTGHSDTVSPEIAKEAGIREYLMKPLAKQELATAVRQVLDARMKE